MKRFNWEFLNGDKIDIKICMWAKWRPSYSLGAILAKIKLKSLNTIIMETILFLLLFLSICLEDHPWDMGFLFLITITVKSLCVLCSEIFPFRIYNGCGSCQCCRACKNCIRNEGSDSACHWGCGDPLHLYVIQRLCCISCRYDGTAWTYCSS